MNTACSSVAQRGEDFVGHAVAQACAKDVARGIFAIPPCCKCGFKMRGVCGTVKYRWTLERIEECRGRGVSVIHIVVGGTQNALLNHLAADATGRTVITGPIEGTAIGNILMQAIARREIKNLDQAREVVRQSFPLFTHEPSSDRAKWDDAYACYLEVSKAAMAF